MKTGAAYSLAVWSHQAPRGGFCWSGAYLCLVGQGRTFKKKNVLKTFFFNFLSLRGCLSTTSKGETETAFVTLTQICWLEEPRARSEPPPPSVRPRRGFWPNGPVGLPCFLEYFLAFFFFFQLCIPGVANLSFKRLGNR